MGAGDHTKVLPLPTPTPHSLTHMSSAAKVGVFMLIVLAILGYFILKIEDVQIGHGTGARKVTAIFDSVAGLDNKSAVRVAGVRVGKVSNIKLRPDGKAEVTLDIDPDVVLHPGASAHVANLGLLGEKYIELDPGPAERARDSAGTERRPARLAAGVDGRHHQPGRRDRERREGDHRLAARRDVRTAGRAAAGGHRRERPHDHGAGARSDRRESDERRCDDGQRARHQRVAARRDPAAGRVDRSHGHADVGHRRREPPGRPPDRREPAHALRRSEDDLRQSQRRHRPDPQRRRDGRQAAVQQRSARSPDRGARLRRKRRERVAQHARTRRQDAARPRPERRLLRRPAATRRTAATRSAAIRAPPSGCA